MQHISKIIQAFADRNGIPERLEVVRAIGPHKVGDVLVWSEEHRGFQGPSGYMMLAGVAGSYFNYRYLKAATPSYTQQTLFAA